MAKQGLKEGLIGLYTEETLHDLPWGLPPVLRLPADPRAVPPAQTHRRFSSLSPPPEDYSSIHRSMISTAAFSGCLPAFSENSAFTSSFLP